MKTVGDCRKIDLNHPGGVYLAPLVKNWKYKINDGNF